LVRTGRQCTWKLGSIPRQRKHTNTQENNYDTLRTSV
jgi:hypothetical protein